MKTFNEYQKEATSTAATYSTPELARMIFGLGLAGEAGEVADLIKKEVGHGHPAAFDKTKKELGDVLWYVANVAASYGYSLQEIAEANLAKLQKRYPNGFSTEASLNRAPEILMVPDGKG